MRSLVKQERCANTVTQLNSPSGSDNDSRAVKKPVSELDDPFKARLEFSGLNVDLGLGELSITRPEFPGLDVDSELDDLSIARLEFPGLDDGPELARDGISIAPLRFSGLNVDSVLGGLSVARLEFSGLNPMSSTLGTVVF